MPTTTVAYRVRIRDATDSSDALIVTSLRGGTNPVIAKAPTGDGQELDPVTGVITTGQYAIDIADAVIAGTTPPQRVITSQLFDSAGRQLLLSRRTYIEESNNGGSTWAATISGYLMNYQLGDAITWTFSVGDTRRIQNTLQVFDGSTFGVRGGLFGGPGVGGAWGPINARGGWKCRVQQANAGIAGRFSANVVLDFVSGYRGINDKVSTRYSDFLGSGGLVEQVNQVAQAFYATSTTKVLAATGQYGSIDSGWGYPGFPGITVRVAEYTGAANNGLFIPSWIPVATPGGGSGPAWLLNATSGNAASIGFLELQWPDGLALPSVGDILTVAAYTSTPSTDSPVYLNIHPAELAISLYAQAGIPFDIPSGAAIISQLGETMRVLLRITQSQTLQDFLEQTLFGPFGFSTRTNAAGVLEFFSTRIKGNSVPGVSIGTADLQDASGIVFENDESTVYSSVRFKSKLFYAYAPNTQTDTNSRPLDSVIEADTQVVIVNADANAFVTQEVVYEIPGLVQDVSGASSGPADMLAFTSAIALEIFDRFGRGAPVCDALAVNAASDTGFNVGDELLIEPAHFPNLGYRFGDNPSVGPRIMQILRRSETPRGPLVKLIDAGSLASVTTPAAVITVAANAGSPRTVAQFTITNAAAINATGTLVTAIQWGTGLLGAPVNGIPFARYAAGATPTVAVQLPAVFPGTKVWVRARTETPGLLPSAWTAWVSVTLGTVPLPTGLTITPVYQNAAQVNWSVANATDLVDVYLFQGSSPPADWSTSFLGTALASTTSALLRNLSGPSIQYQVAIAHRDPSTGVPGTLVTGSFTTNSASIGTAPTPKAFAIMPTTQDASLLTGIMLALYASNPIYDLVIERAPDVSGSPGTWAEIAQIAGRSAYFTDWLPNDAVIRWYRVKARLSGETDSGYLAAQSAVPGAVTTVQPGGPGAGPIPVTTAPAPASSVPVITVYSAAGSFSHTCAATTTRVHVKATGAGGGADLSFSGSTTDGNGGGGGAVVEADEAVTGGQILALVVGAAGTFGANSGGSGIGTDGGDTTVDSTVIVAGGGKNGQPFNGSGSETPGGTPSTTLPNAILRDGGVGSFSGDGDTVIDPNALFIIGGVPWGGGTASLRFTMTQLGTSAVCLARQTANGPGCGAVPASGLSASATDGEIIVWEYT